jgi:hypothetical protein
VPGPPTTLEDRVGRQSSYEHEIPSAEAHVGR